MNLDPFNEYTDSQLWTALDRVHLRHSVTALPGQLDFQCGEEGGNLRCVDYLSWLVCVGGEEPQVCWLSFLVSVCGRGGTSGVLVIFLG